MSDELLRSGVIFGSVVEHPCALNDAAPDEHGFLTCDRCQHCAPPFLIEDWCKDRETADGAAA